MKMKRTLKWSTHADLAIRKTPTVGREEFLDHMTFLRNDRPLFTEIFGPIVGLKEEWEEQGATPAELDFSAFSYRCEARGHLPVHTGMLGGYPEQRIEETEDHKIWRDGLGRTMKLPKGVATLALPLDYPVRNMDDWLKIKPWFTFSEARFAFYGGIDKHVIRRRREDIVKELEYKIPPMVRTGGCVLGLDHRIPNGTPLAHYRFYLDKAWEIMNRCAGGTALTGLTTSGTET
jgi:hypothetical protein